MDRSLTITEHHGTQLRSLVFPPGGNEGAAILLCGVAEIEHDPWSGRPTRRYISFEVVPIPADHIVSVSRDHVRCRTATLAKVLKRAAAESLVVGIVHSHPGGIAKFSLEDDTQEPYSVELAKNRNGPETELLSIVITETAIAARTWTDLISYQEIGRIAIVGNQINLTYPGRFGKQAPEAFHRQALTFGPALVHDLQHLRIGIAGAGATGSATATLIGRLGGQRLVAIDEDHADETNLSRLHGATIEDAKNNVPKVDILKRHIEGFGLGAQVRTFKTHLGDSYCRDALLSCDVIFGCTDDNDGRLLLSRLAYYYSIPVIDMGIGIDPTDDNPPRIREAAGRVTVLLPGSRCLLCRRVIDTSLAEEEATARANPALFAERRKRGYVRGGAPNPAVVTFTTDVASMAVDELIHRLTGYRSTGARDHRVRKYHLLDDKRPGATETECPICRSEEIWGRGDVTPFLDRVG